MLGGIMMNKTMKTKMKSALATTLATTVLLSSGLPAFTPQAQASETVNPTLPTLDTGTPEFIDGEYIVTFKEGTSSEQMNQVIEQYGGKKIDGEYDTNIISLKLTNKQYEQIKQEPLVEIIEKNQEVKLSGYGQLYQYSHEKTNVPNAWKSGLTGKGIEIAILDTGITNHKDLDIAGGVSTVEYTNSYLDDNGHGSNVAGIIASKDNNEGTTGVASDADIYSVKVLNYAGKGDLMDIIEGMDWAIQKGVDIINVSLGTYSNSATLKAKVDEAVEKGIIVVAASGNTGDTNITYPAKYDNVVAVGATDQNNNRASFSTYGPQVDVVAPGVGIVSTYLGNMYANGNGTSQAAPYVSGILALYSQQYPDKSAKELVQMLYDNALDLGAKGKDNHYGHGLVQFPSANEEVEQPKEEVKEEPKQEKPVVEKEPKEPVVEEQPVQEEKTVEKEQPKEEVKEEPKQDIEIPEEEEDITFELPKGVTFDIQSNTISWESFANANRYRIAVDEKQDNGSYKQHRYPQTVSKTEYNLTRARLADNEEYKISIIPRVGFRYEEDQALELFASSKGDTLVITGQESQTKEKNDNPVIEQPSKPMKETVPSDSNSFTTELPEGITFDKKGKKILWEDFAGANRYRVKMETIDSNGKLEQYKYPRTVIKPEFRLSYLRDKDNYKITIIPRIGFSYEENQAKELFVSTKGKEVIVAGLSEDLKEMVNQSTKFVQPPVKQADETALSHGLAYNEKTDTISWDKVDGTNRYRLEMERKNSKGEYTSYSYKRTIIGSEFKTERILPKGHEYKVKIVPRIGYKYDYDKAFDIYVSTEDGKVVIKSLS